MSNTPPVTSDVPPPAPAQGREIAIIGHSNLVYWWPVWLLGFLFAAVTYWDDQRAAIVPAGTVAERSRQVAGVDGPRDVLILPAGKSLQPEEGGAPVQPHVRLSTNINVGGFFTLALLLVLLITNVSLRGIWSVVLILSIITLALFLALMHWWDDVLRLFGLVHIHINASGYLIIAAALFVVWVLTTFVFDRLVYMVFSPGQFRVHLEVGEGETAFDAVGMAIHKRRNDFFRHWVLGLGSGDLVVKTGGAHPQTFEISNVLFVGRKVQILEQMLQEREVVPGQLHSGPLPRLPVHSG